jgi:hypothetical protein
MVRFILFSLATLFLAGLAFAKQLPEALDDIKIVGEVDSGWEYWLLKLQTCSTPDECELYKRAAKDSYLRILYIESGTSGDSEAKSFFDVAPNTNEISVWLKHSDESNRTWLASRVERDGWFTISEYGEDADLAAFLIVQHSDLDRDFQRRILSLLETLLEQRDTGPSSWAMLHDRLSVFDGLPQRFGSQGRCVDKNDWQPWEIEDQERLDERRTAHDMMPMSAYKMRLNERCANFSG